MDEFLNDESVQEVIERIKHRTFLRLQRQSRNYSARPDVANITEQDRNDVYAREVLKEPALREEIRIDILSGLVQASPGGILAMNWLCKVTPGDITPDMIKEFSVELASSELYNTKLTRSASQETLNSEDSISCVDYLLSKNGLSEDDRVAAVMCFLSSNCFSENGRSSILSHCSGEHALGLSDTAINRLNQWAIGFQVDIRGRLGFLNEIPEPPAFLARSAMIEFVRLGNDAAKLIKHVIQSIDCWEDSRYVLHAILDLVECGSVKMDNTISTVCIKSDNASVRRRVYSLATSNKVQLNAEESKKLLDSALRDKDVSIRNWAVNRSRQEAKN